MKSSYKLIVNLVSITIGGLGNSLPVQALDVVCQSAIVDKKTHKFEFTIGFNKVPAFFLLMSLADKLIHFSILLT